MNAVNIHTTEGWTGTFTPDLKDVFVPLELVGSRQFGREMLRLKADSEQEGSKIWDILRQIKPNQGLRMGILSPGGYGKTTLLRHITYIYGTKRYRRFSVPLLLPVLIYLRHWQETLAQNLDQDLSDFIEQHHIPDLPEQASLKLPSSWSKTQLLQGKMLVMFDGFDEVKLAWRRDISLWIGEQMRKYPRAVFMVTSRPAAFDAFKADNLQIQLEVRNFSPKQQQEFISRWYRVRQRFDKSGRFNRTDRVTADRKANSLILQLSQDEKLKKLAKKPLELNLLINLHHLYPSPDELPKYQTEIYREIISLQLGDRPLKKKIVMGIAASDAQNILQKIALFMFQQEGTKTEIEYDVLKDEIAKLLLVNQEQITAIEFIDKIEKVSELIVKNDENYQFSHLSFQAYLAALEIQGTAQEDLLLENWEDYFWKETIKLYAAITKKPSQFIRRLLEIQDPEAQKLADNCLREIPDDKIDADLKSRDQQELVNLESLKQENFLFKQLEKYLKNQQFKEADEETERVMLQVVGKEANQYLSVDDIKNFPCEELRIIDDLWKKYSNGKFGFSVQKQIWLDCGGVPGEYEWEPFAKFASQVGWLVNTNWYEDMNFSISGVQGHLPSRTPTL